MQLTFPLMGASFRPAEAKAVLRSLQPGDTVTLDPDLQNEYDPAAVRVLAKGQHIGFLPRGSLAIYNRLVDGDVLTAEILSFEGPHKPTLSVQL